MSEFYYVVPKDDRMISFVTTKWKDIIKGREKWLFQYLLGTFSDENSPELSDPFTVTYKGTEIFKLTDPEMVAEVMKRCLQEPRSQGLTEEMILEFINDFKVQNQKPKTIDFFMSAGSEKLFDDALKSHFSK